MVGASGILFALCFVSPKILCDRFLLFLTLENEAKLLPFWFICAVDGLPVCQHVKNNPVRPCGEKMFEAVPADKAKCLKNSRTKMFFHQLFFYFQEKGIKDETA